MDGDSRVALDCDFEWSFNLPNHHALGLVDLKKFDDKLSDWTFSFSVVESALPSAACKTRALKVWISPEDDTSSENANKSQIVWEESEKLEGERRYLNILEILRISRDNWNQRFKGDHGVNASSSTLRCRRAKRAANIQ